MADQRKGKMKDGYELNLDDTVSSWDEVVEEAVAAVEKIDDDPGAVSDSAEAADHAGERASGDRSSGDRSSGGDGTADDSASRGLREQLVRTLADFDNYRKRTDREKAQMQRYALFDVLKDFLDVSDNLERALAASGSATDLKTGVEMIARQFADLLRRYGVERIEAVGEPFDPTVHEAVVREESSEIEVPTVTAEMQRGYRLHDRLLRPAMVTVAMPAGGGAGAKEKARNEVGEEIGHATEAS